MCSLFFIYKPRELVCCCSMQSTSVSFYFYFYFYCYAGNKKDKKTLLGYIPTTIITNTVQLGLKPGDR